MTREDYINKLNAVDKEICEFIAQHKDVFKKYDDLQLQKNNIERDIDNKKWLIGSYFKFYCNGGDEFYIHVNNCNHRYLYGECVRIVKNENEECEYYKTGYIENSTIKMFDNMPLTVIEESEFNSVKNKFV